MVQVNIKMNTNRFVRSFVAGKFWRLGLLAFVAGVVVMSLELVASRVLIPVFGGSIYTWGSLIGAILTGLSLGYYVGGRLADKDPNFLKLCSIVFSAGLYIVFIPYVAPIVLESSVSIGKESPYTPLLATFALLAMPTILLGIVSPYAVKLATNTLMKLGNVAGNLYSLSAIGSIIGTFMTVFVLIPSFEVRQIIFALGLTLMLVSLLGLPRIPKVITVLVIILIFLPSSSVVVGLVSHSGTLLYEKETSYSHLDVADSGNIRTLYLNGLPHSQMYKDKPNELVITYTKYFHLGMILNPDAEKVLFVGGGGFSGPKNFLTLYPDIQVDVVEIDPDVIETAKNYFSLNDSPRLRIFNDDARNFLLKTDEKYDIIILDAFSKSYVPFHLMTLEYFLLLHDKLQPNGVIISNLLTSLVGDTSNLFRAVYKTMNEVFPVLYVFPTGHYSKGVVQNVMVLAMKVDKQYSKYDMMKLAEDNGLDGAFAGVDYLDHYLTAEIKTNDVPLLTDQFAPVENLINPVTSKSYVIEEQTAGNGKSIPWIESTSVTIGLLLLIAIFWIFYLQRIWKVQIHEGIIE